MKSYALSASLVITAICLTACRQPDGPMPQVTDESQNRVHDLSRDLLSVAGGDQGARQDFADDLRVFLRGEQAAAAGDKLAASINEALPGKKLSEPSSQQLAQSLWTAVAARELSERQIEALKNDFKSQLTALSVPDERVQATVTEVGEVQKAISLRPRRWYERS